MLATGGFFVGPVASLGSGGLGHWIGLVWLESSLLGKEG